MKKFNNKKQVTKKRIINKYPKGYVKYSHKDDSVLLQFDKNGGLCDVKPRVADIFNTYKGRTRAFVPEMFQILNEYYKNVQ